MPDNSNNAIDRLDLRDALSERYLAYALSTIMHRALPDVRDGLKPVHRRIIYAMNLLRLAPGQSYAKCARIVGDVMGKFHPHGDVSIYDALVRLAQDFSMRYPLIDGQGNFGNIDGDNAAAMRYTEARMTDLTSYLLEGLNQDSVDFNLTYNEEDKEPSVLPSAFPNILANGASGIAVGMATSIPPHNIIELCEACLYLIKNKQATTRDLLEYVKGPDFPTGGVLITDEHELEEAYETGRGSFRLRSNWYKEPTERNGYIIVIDQIPFQVQKNRLVTKVQDLVYARKLPMIEDIRDESDENIRIVIEPKNRNVDATLLMEALFKLTEFEVKVPLNMNVLSFGKVPNVLSLKQVLQQWLDHRQEVLQRCTRFRLNNIKNRLELLEGYLIAYLNIDEIIQIIREEDHPKPELINRFGLTDIQAEAILNMKLRSLRKLEEFELRKEAEDLKKEQIYLNNLLSSNEKQLENIAKEISELLNNSSKLPIISDRRTKFGDAVTVVVEDIEQAMIEKEAVTIVLSEKGWVRSLKGHSIDRASLSYKDGDKEKFIINAYTTDKLLLISGDGKMFTLNVNNLPGGRGHGDPIRVMLDINNEEEIVSAFIYENEQNILIVSTDGYGFITEHQNLLSLTKKGKHVMSVKEPNKVLKCETLKGDHIAIVGSNRRLLIFPTSQLPLLKKGKGVRLQKYTTGIVSDITSFNMDEGLLWIDSSGRSFNKKADDLEDWIGNRANTGKMAPRGFPKNNKFK